MFMSSARTSTLKPLQPVSLSMTLMMLAGCAGLSELQQPISQFDSGVHTVSVAQKEFLNTVEQADCESQFLTKAYKYSISCVRTARTPTPESCGKVSIQLVKYCSPSVLSGPEIASRDDMMDALSLYADKLLGLASGDQSKSLSADVQTGAKNLESAANSGHITLPHQAPAIVAAVGTAFTAIAEMALDQRKYDGAVNAAKAMQANVHLLVDALKKENYADAQSVMASYQLMEGELRAELLLMPGPAVTLSASLRPEKSMTGRPSPQAGAAKREEALSDSMARVHAAETYFAYVEARDLLGTETGRTRLQLATADWDADNLATSLNKALDSLAASNDAIAKGAAGGISAAAHDLYARVVAARDQYKSMSP